MHPRTSRSPWRLAAPILLATALSVCAADAPFRRGDSNADAGLDLSDPIHVLGYLFLGSPDGIDCLEAANSNADQVLDLADPIFSLAYLFQGGPAPPPPGPFECGEPAEPGLGCAAYPACGAPPTILEGPSADPAEVEETGSTRLAVVAEDPEGGPLSYAWTQASPESPAGSFDDPAGASPSWSAPEVDADTIYTLRVVVSTPRGARAQGEVAVSVRNANRPPTIDSGPAATPPAASAGRRVTLAVAASDPDGDPLSYSWEPTEPPGSPGTFVAGRDLASAVWYSPPLAAEATFAFRVSVSDGRSDPVSATVRVTVSPPAFGTDVQPIFTASCSCHQGPFPSAGMSLAAGSAHSSLVDAPAIACAPLRRVLPGDPEASVLVRKITGGSCGSRMPFSDPGFFDRNPDLVVRIRSWILAGARDD